MKLYLGRYFCIFSADFFENDFAMRPHRAHARMGPCPMPCFGDANMCVAGEGYIV